MTRNTHTPKWLHPIKLPMPAALGKINTYLVDDGPVGLVDTGMSDSATRNTLEAALSQRGHGVADVSRVICTHHHVDHAGLGAHLQHAGAKVYMSPQDAHDMERFFAEPHRDSDRAAFYGRHPIESIFIERITGLFTFFRKLAEPFAPDGTVEDGQVIELGGRSFEVWITPGHTAGHVCLVEHQERIVLTGDHLIRAHPTHVSLRREGPGADPMGQFFSSLARLNELDGYTAHTGHGSPFSEIAAQVNRTVLAHRDKLRRYESALTIEPASAFALSEIVMQPGKKIFAQWLAMSQTLAYLEHLCEIGTAQEVIIDGLAFYRKR